MILRKAGRKDLLFLMRLRNDAAVRASAFDGNPVAPSVHREWFEKKLAGADSVIFVADLDGKRIGQVRFDADGKTYSAEADIAVAPAFRGRGLAVKLLKAGCVRAVRELGVKKIFAHIKPGNEGSLRAFASAGFVNRGVVDFSGRKCIEMVFAARAGQKRRRPLKMKPRVTIYTEGSRAVGFGHITRCMAIAAAFDAAGADVSVTINGDKTAEENFSGGMTAFGDWMKKAAEGKIPCADVTLVDSYLAGIDVYRNLRAKTGLLACIDDNLRLDYPADVIVNGTIGAEKFPYPRGSGARYLLGAKYIPLRRSFVAAAAPRPVRKNIQKIMVTFGAEDSRRLTPAVLSMLAAEFPGAEKYAIIGKAFEDIRGIKSAGDSKTKFFFNPDDRGMSRVMRECDAAVSGAGQTLYELARTGLPTVAIAVARNQLRNLDGWRKNGFVESAGAALAARDVPRAINAVKNALNRLAAAAARQKKSRLGKKAVDGKGAERISSAILDMYTRSRGGRNQP